MKISEPVEKAAARLHAARPEAMIILFGSQARGDARPDSDVDFLVVEPEVNSRREEMTFLSNLLRPLRLPADVLVASRRTFEKWAALPGTIYHTARTEGRVLYGRAGEVSARPEICGNFAKPDGGDANDRGASQFFATPSPIPMVPEGHLKIAQHFSAGSAMGEAPSPARDGRLIPPLTRSSLRDLRMEAAYPALKCWAILGRPSGTAKTVPHRCKT